jgi:hypothetical protein
MSKSFLQEKINSIIYLKESITAMETLDENRTYGQRKLVNRIDSLNQRLNA